MSVPQNSYRKSAAPSLFLITGSNTNDHAFFNRATGEYLAIGYAGRLISLNGCNLLNFRLFPRLATTQNFSAYVRVDMTYDSATKWFETFSPYSRSLIIRGIGYRLYPVVCATSPNNQLSGRVAYAYGRYIYLRAGHSFSTYCGIPNSLGLKASKKERKMVIYGFSDADVGTFADRLFYYRPPNAFTGRGIRFKRARYKRKPGKRAQKGRSF